MLKAILDWIDMPQPECKAPNVSWNVRPFPAHSAEAGDFILRDNGRSNVVVGQRDTMPHYLS